MSIGSISHLHMFVEMTLQGNYTYTHIWSTPTHSDQHTVGTWSVRSTHPLKPGKMGNAFHI